MQFVLFAQSKLSPNLFALPLESSEFAGSPFNNNSSRSGPVDFGWNRGENYHNNWEQSSARSKVAIIYEIFMTQIGPGSAVYSVFTADDGCCASLIYRCLCSNRYLHSTDVAPCTVVRMGFDPLPQVFILLFFFATLSLVTMAVPSARDRGQIKHGSATEERTVLI